MKTQETGAEVSLPFPRHDFAQPALALDEPRGEVKVSMLRTVVPIPELANLRAPACPGEAA